MSGTKKHILVTGANGQLGTELQQLAPLYTDYDFTFTDTETLDITDPEKVNVFFKGHHFSYCINCAAYTAVDKAESEKEKAFAVNANGPGLLAAACKKNNTAFVHISTDYVFDGSSIRPYEETDMVNPLGVYGESKLAGEERVMKENRDAIIIRTSWVYSSYGKNFVKTMMRLMQERDSIGVVNDQKGSPTYAADLAAVILQIIGKGISPGIYHYCNEGVISWYDFAVAIKEIISSACIVNAITTAEYPTPAKRPAYSALNTQKIKSTFTLSIPNWKDSLRRCIKVLAAIHPDT